MPRVLSLYGAKLGGRMSVVRLNERVEKVTPRNAESLRLSKPGADIVGDRERKVETPTVLNLYG